MSAVKHDFHFRICAWPGRWLLNSVCYNVCRKEQKKAEKEDTWTLDEIWNKVLAGGDAKKGSITTLHLAAGKAAFSQHLCLIFRTIFLS